MAKKPDFSALKPILFQYGDKAVLALSVIATVLLITMGLLSAKNASSVDWADQIKSAGNALEQKLQSAPIPDPDPARVAALEVSKYRWDPFTSSFVSGPFIHLGETPDIKRRNPLVLPVKEGEDYFQLDYVKGLYFDYGIDTRAQTVEVFAPTSAGGAGPAAAPPNAANQPGAQKDLVKAAEPVRMVLVRGVFPMRDQLEQFKMAFRLNSQSELFTSKDLPRPLSVDVYRYEVLPDGKLGTKTPLYLYTKDTVEVAAPIKEVLRRAMFDEEGLNGLDPYLHAGLLTPIPLLANVSYPKLMLSAFEVPPPDPAVAKQAVPMQPGPAAGKDKDKDGIPIKSVPWRQLPPEQKLLTDRFSGIFEPFHPFALALGSTDPTQVNIGGGPGMRTPNMAAGPRSFDAFDKGLVQTAGPAVPMPGPGMPSGPGMKGPRPIANQPTTVATETWRYDALIRFIDVGVEPGKSYCWEMRVRMANPNYKKSTEVAYEALADVKEIVATKWVRTPVKSIPLEYSYYAVDQLALDKAGQTIPNKELLKPDQAALQIHRWFDAARDLGSVPPRDYVVGDWGIAERLTLRRGEFIGHPQMITEVPVWTKDKQTFEIPQTLDPNAKGKDKDKRKPGVPLDFTPPPDPAKKGALLPPPLVVDFEGGRRDNYRVVPFDRNDKSIQLTITRDESAMDVLIMAPDGTLTVRNSRRESDPTTPQGKERRDRVELWRDHLRQADAAAPANPTGPALPGGINLPGVQRKN
jgi:hypothetical protein